MIIFFPVNDQISFRNINNCAKLTLCSLIFSASALYCTSLT